MMGDIFNLLFQNKRCMVASGLCTESQYESGVIKIVHHMDRALEHLDINNHSIVLSDQNEVKNEWDNDEEVVFQYPSAKKAEKELEEFHKFEQRHYLPKMRAMKNCVTYDANGQPLLVPKYFIVAVVH